MSTLKVNNIQNASGGSNSTPEQIEQGRAKVWCSFDGTSGGTNKTIRDDFNVSTVVDNGTGDYTINYSITFANTNYVLAGTGGPNSEYISNHLTGAGTSSAYTTTSCRFTTRATNSNGLSDAVFVEIIIFGDV
tara:strand:+ start:421 stop:819 length:399 start_codon:yes stop_codon:yes gene_type:complete